MEKRPLGKTGVEVTKLSFGASSLGQEFRRVDLAEAVASVRAALDVGMNFIDTSPYYGRGLSECLLGQVLPQLPRDRYLLGTKLGRYAPQHFDFSARRVAESIDVSLERLGVEYLDIALCHDIEYGDLAQIVEETLPALRRQVELGKVRFIGVSGYPMKIFQYVIERAPIDVLLTYNHYTLQNDMALQLVEPCRQRGIGLINAAPFSARLLTTAPLPSWHKAPAEVRRIARQAAEHCTRCGTDLAKAALQFSLDHPDFATCVTGSANPQRIRQWAEWAAEPIDRELIEQLRQILAPIHNWHYLEGRPENNDDESDSLPAAATT